MSVDEFQEAQLEDRKSLLMGLQHFDGDPDPPPVAIVAAADGPVERAAIAADRSPELRSSG